MPHAERVRIPVGDLTLYDGGGERVAVQQLQGVQLLVLLRHRH